MENNIIVGNMSRFAIEFKIELLSDPWTFGKLFFWFKNMRFGDPNDTVALNDSYLNAKHFVEKRTNLINDVFYKMDITEAVEKVVDYSTVEYENDMHHFDFIGMSSFDHYGDFFALIKNTNGDERVVWMSELNGIGEMYLNQNEIESVLCEFVIQYEKQMDIFSNEE